MRTFNMKFKKFFKTFKSGKLVHLRDSYLWYCLDYDMSFYLKLSINQRINYKQEL